MQQENQNQNLQQMLEMMRIMQGGSAADKSQRDTINKAVQGALGLLVVWLFTQVNTHNQSIVDLRAKDEAFVSEFKNMAAQTDNKLALAVNPLRRDVDSYRRELASRGEWMGTTEKRITALEQKFDVIEEDLEEIKSLLKRKR